MNICQKICPERTVFNCGDIVRIYCSAGAGLPEGKMFFRTDVNNAADKRREEIDFTEKGRNILECAWRDLPMSRGEDADGRQVYYLDILLSENGCFAGKCYYAPADGGKMLWSDGDNIRIKVGSAVNVGENFIYTAFVRQFGGQQAANDAGLLAGAEKLDRADYTVIPPSGTFRDVIRKLDLIFDELGCRILQLLPVHPAPAQYGKMGRYGSPFAALDYFAVDSSLAEFDTHATPLEQFEELIMAVHSRRGRIFMDIPVNHTGWASKVQQEHPEYFVRRSDGEFESPGAWGIVWEDLCKLDYSNEKVHKLMADVFLYWCRRGIDGFRCDAGYMLPESAWKYIVAKVRREYPDTVFMLEGLGGPMDTQWKLLSEAGLDWAYSELFQNYSRDEISSYYPVMQNFNCHSGALVNFAETHDNSRLAAKGHTYAKMRLALSAFLSESGCFGFANGVEFFAAEQINVHRNSFIDWNNPDNAVGLIRTLQNTMRNNRLFFAGAQQNLIQTGGGNVIAVRRYDGKTAVLGVINLDCEYASHVNWRRSDAPFSSPVDLLTGRKVEIFEGEGGGAYSAVSLAPGGFMLIGEKDADYRPENSAAEQMARAAAFGIWRYFNGDAAVEGEKCRTWGEKFLHDCAGFCRMAAGTKLPPVMPVELPEDEHRLIMLPHRTVMLCRDTAAFDIEIKHGNTTLGTAKSFFDGKHYFAVIFGGGLEEHRGETVEALVRRYTGTGNSVLRLHVMLLDREAAETVIKTVYTADEIKRSDLAFVHTNSRGGMSQIRANWGKISSKYDALLAANFHPSLPVDRRVMLTRCRMWLQCREYSQSIDIHSLTEFAAFPPHRAQWNFEVPVGQGKRVRLVLSFTGAEDGDSIRLEISRPASDNSCGILDDGDEVRIIVRPDLEDRVNHELTRAYIGPEKAFPGAVKALRSGFDFTPPGGNLLHMDSSRGRFVREDEWHYMEHLDTEERYGQEHKTDLYSPGYFEMPLCGGESAVLSADAGEGGTMPDKFAETPQDMGSMLKTVLRQFVVKRDSLSTVIAGYPWFLDWGRDTLIALRGIIAAGMTGEAELIIRQFAEFECGGTIPNVIRGSDISNRDTSDAPLWLAVAASDLCAAAGEGVLSKKCGSRTLLEVLSSIIRHYRSGTANGIAMDGESGLIFSPPHFTWMDTNYPAGTPRCGYPVEIQALWYAALKFMAKYDNSCAELAEKVQQSIVKYFYRPEDNIFGDCIHASGNTGAANGVTDDHIRCNALFAVTLGAVQDEAVRGTILAQSSLLLIPGGLRSLADREVKYLLPVDWQGQRLNDERHPYWGHYRGSEDFCRKAAYHNGTAWMWPFPSYCEALAMSGGKAEITRAKELLASVKYFMESTSPGQLPEIADGSWPHRPQGCLAQAWSVSEAYRVLKKLEKMQ